MSWISIIFASVGSSTATFFVKFEFAERKENDVATHEYTLNNEPRIHAEESSFEWKYLFKCIKIVGVVFIFSRLLVFLYHLTVDARSTSSLPLPLPLIVMLCCWESHRIPFNRNAIAIDVEPAATQDHSIVHLHNRINWMYTMYIRITHSHTLPRTRSF